MKLFQRQGAFYCGKDKILLAAAIAGALGLVGISWSLSSSPSPRPVAIMHQSRPIVASASNVAAISEAEVPSSQLALTPNSQLQSLKALSKDSDRIQTAAKQTQI